MDVGGARPPLLLPPLLGLIRFMALCDIGVGCCNGGVDCGGRSGGVADTLIVFGVGGLEILIFGAGDFSDGGFGGILGGWLRGIG